MDYKYFQIYGLEGNDNDIQACARLFNEQYKRIYNYT